MQEHAFKHTDVEEVMYPDHPPRTESKTFEHTKEAGHKKHTLCAISGSKTKVEYHHLFCEWALESAIDWKVVKGVGTGEIKELPVLDLETDLTTVTGETFPVEDSLLWLICKLAEFKGFDWHSFDPSKPETFVDSMANMLVLHEKFHRGNNHGIHELSFPIWIFQAFPRLDGFVFTKDELVNAHNKITATASIGGA